MIEKYYEKHHKLLLDDSHTATAYVHSRIAYRTVKRGFDIAATLILAPLAIAMVATLAVLVRIDGGGSAFYRQPRLGKGGKVFNIWKLRTMVPDAERALQECLKHDAAARQEWDHSQKLRHDPRITRLGCYLRKYSFDELPQLLNVFLGQMSLVGPRPMCPEQRPQYPGNAYFDLRPGITGLWQVSARNNSSFAERATYDARYAAGMSFSMDMRILLLTPFAVLRGTGM